MPPATLLRTSQSVAAPAKPAAKEHWHVAGDELTRLPATTPPSQIVGFPTPTAPALPVTFPGERRRASPGLHAQRWWSRRAEPFPETWSRAAGRKKDRARSPTMSRARQTFPQKFQQR